MMVVKVTQPGWIPLYPGVTFAPLSRPSEPLGMRMFRLVGKRGKKKKKASHSVGLLTGSAAMTIRAAILCFTVYELQSHAVQK